MTERGVPDTHLVAYGTTRHEHDIVYLPKVS